MPSKSPLLALQDILHHIDLAALWTKESTLETFVADARTVYAATRCLEIISEASRRLPAHPSIDWKGMAGAGNVYRHQTTKTSPRVWRGRRRMPT
jgi:uncharacterized protein with HEPN domain